MTITLQSEKLMHTHGHPGQSRHEYTHFAMKMTTLMHTQLIEGQAKLSLNLQLSPDVAGKAVSVRCVVKSIVRVLVQ